MSYVDRIKNDPVMNAVFNSKQKMLRYLSRNYTQYDRPSNTVYYINELVHLDPARQPGELLRKKKFRDFGIPYRRLGLPERQPDGSSAPGGETFRARYNDPTIEYRHNPDLYWINMLPKDLYNINYVNKPNPIIGSLKNLPIHISSLHKSFA